MDFAERSMLWLAWVVRSALRIRTHALAPGTGGSTPRLGFFLNPQVRAGADLNHTATIFWNFESDTDLDRGSRAMFKMPAYDPIGIVIIGFGILVAQAPPKYYHPSIRG
jgi:hypothetical protein